MLNTINKICHFLTTRRISILCGAGISYDSGLPIVDSFYENFFPKIYSVQDSKDIINTLHTNAIPFEKIIETVLTTAKNHELLKMFNYGIPNLNHILISKMFASDWLNEIYTTNFDCLIETSLEHERIFKNIHYGLYYNEDNYKHISNGLFKKIVKLHGSADEIDSIRIALTSIASARLSKTRKLPVKRLFHDGDHEAVLVLGYSFSDIFDINLFIEQLDKIGKKVVVVEHTNDLDVSSIENIHVKGSKNPFSYKKSNGIRIHTNTTGFLKKLWETRNQAFNFDIAETTISNNVSQEHYNWKNKTEDWILSLGKSRINLIAGILWNSLYYYEKGLAYLLIAASECILKEETIDLYLSIKLQILLSKHRIAKNADDAITVIKECELTLIELKKWKDVLPADRYNIVASDLYFRLGRLTEDNLRNPSLALKYYFSAYRIDFHNNDSDGMAKCLHQIGTIYSFRAHTKLALKCFRKSIKIKKRIGYIGGIARSTYEIGNAYFIIGNDKKAYKYYDNTEQLLNTGELDLKAFILNQKALIFYNSDDFKTAKKLFRKKEKLSIIKGHYLSSAILNYNLGRCERELGNYKEAIRLLRKAKKVHEDLNQEEYYFRDCQELALTYLLKENYRKAGACLFLLESKMNSDKLSLPTVSHFFMYLALYYKKIKDSENYKSCLYTASSLFKENNNSKAFYKLKNRFFL